MDSEVVTHADKTKTGSKACYKKNAFFRGFNFDQFLFKQKIPVKHAQCKHKLNSILRHELFTKQTVLQYFIILLYYTYINKYSTYFHLQFINISQNILETSSILCTIILLQRVSSHYSRIETNRQTRYTKNINLHCLN